MLQSSIPQKNNGFRRQYSFKCASYRYHYCYHLGWRVTAQCCGLKISRPRPWTWPSLPRPRPRTSASGSRPRSRTNIPDLASILHRHMLVKIHPIFVGIRLKAANYEGKKVSLLSYISRETMVQLKNITPNLPPELTPDLTLNT